MVLQLNSCRKSNNCLIACMFCQDADEEVVVTEAPKKKKKKRDVEEVGLAEPDATGTHFLLYIFAVSDLDSTISIRIDGVNTEQQHTQSTTHFCALKYCRS